MIHNDTLLEALRRMLRIRYAESMVAEDFRENKIFSFYHSSVGQEAVAAGVGLGLAADDHVFGNHRSHGHYLGKNGNLYAMLAEIYGKADGCCKGYGGSMHMLARSVGFMGSSPILGSAVPIALGNAFTQKYKNTGKVTAVFFGDGASEEGAVYESVNLASVKKLPILFVLEDNLYAVASAQSARRGVTYQPGNVYRGLGAAYVKVDGNSFDAVYQAVQSARDCTARWPTVLHTVTYREMAHSGPITDEKSRVGDTKEIRQQNDPIKKLLEQLRSRGTPEEILSNIQMNVESEVHGCFLAAKAAEEPVCQ